MRARPPLTVLLLAASVVACAQPGQLPPGESTHVPTMTIALAAHAPAPGGLSSHRVDFATQIRPILVAHCQPCHFAGGKMYQSLPFDRAGTVLKLREKLFTRLKDERERRTIREFLAQHPGSE
jgi:hypothetical protein